jgi:hypothetical protein
MGGKWRAAGKAGAPAAHSGGPVPVPLWVSLNAVGRTGRDGGAIGVRRRGDAARRRNGPRRPRHRVSASGPGPYGPIGEGAAAR